jgi:uncharacterized protein (DUF302 family)
VGLQALDVHGDCFVGIGERLIQSVPLCVTSRQGRTADVKTAIRLPFQDDGVAMGCVVDHENILARRDMKKKPDYRNFTVARPKAAHSAEISQKRTTTCCSLQPFRWKW